MKLNRYQFIGNIGADAQVRVLDGSTQAVISFSVAVTEKWKNQQGAQQEKTYWVRCSIWRKSDQTAIAQYLTKGTMVYVEGKPEARAYVDGQGNAAASLEVNVSDVQLLSSSQRTQQPVQAPQAAQPQQVRQPIRRDPQPFQGPPSNSAPVDDDLPF